MSIRANKSIFTFPELVIELVHVYLNPSDSACLARSNKHLFRMVMPLLWGRVDGVSQLLALLPALNGTDEAKNGQMPEKTLTEDDFSRFDIYAPWVKHLEVCHNLEPPPSDHRLNALRHRSTVHVLPNLKSITSTNTEGLADITWILPFLSPSLISLEFIIISFGQIPELPPLESSVLLRALATKCPKLQTLLMIVNTDEDYSDLHALQSASTNDKSEAGGRHPLSLSPFIAVLHPLVDLTFSAEILDQACFRTISTWPSLESLTIVMDPPAHDYTLPKLNDDSFLALNHLGLYWIPGMDTFRRIWSCSALTKKLASCKLLPSCAFCHHTNPEFSDTLIQILSVLAEHTPSLENLWLRVLHPDALRPYYDVSLAVLTPLQKLPLQILYIEGIHFGDHCSDQGAKAYTDESVAKRKVFIEYFATFFPALRKLGFPLHRVSWADSPIFHTLLPQFEALHFDFDLLSLRQEDVNLDKIPRYRQSPFRILEANFLGIFEDSYPGIITDFQYDDVVWLVNYLFSIWPNVQIAAQPDEEESGDRTPHYKMIALINDHLAVLSSCNRDASVKYEDVRILNKDSWAECEVLFRQTSPYHRIMDEIRREAPYMRMTPRPV